jgi:small-conductance mechanosensitive channel
MTFVVVRIWDLRRLVLPISYFIEKPFENWTRTTADILGSVILYMDYGVPLDEVRAEFGRALRETELWDGKVEGLQVTDCTERTMQLRLLMSARNSSDAWTLRCAVRERVIAYLQQHHSDSLPRLRLENLSDET